MAKARNMSGRPAGVLLLVDRAAARRLERIDTQLVGNEYRYYYVLRGDRDTLFHLVARAQPIEEYEGRVADANIGWGEGWHGKCHPGHEGLKLTKVTLHCIVDDGTATRTLTDVIATSPHISRARRVRTRRWGGETRARV